MRTLRGCVLYEGLFTRRYFIYSGAYHTRVRTLCQCVFQPDAYLTWMRTSLFTYKLKIDQSKLTSLDSFSKQLILGFFNFDQSILPSEKTTIVNNIKLTIKVFSKIQLFLFVSKQQFFEVKFIHFSYNCFKFQNFLIMFGCLHTTEILSMISIFR